MSVFIIFIFIYNSYLLFVLFFFFFNDTATTEIYTLSLHDALPISWSLPPQLKRLLGYVRPYSIRLALGILLVAFVAVAEGLDRKSTRLNSSHSQNSYAVFCLKKKKKKEIERSSECTDNIS